MQGIKRKVVYISLYEGLAIVAASAGLSLMSGQGLDRSAPLAIASSVVAMMWNLAFNTAFERWESAQRTKGRSLGRRVAHAIGFEGGLAALLVPMFAWVLGVTVVDAFVMDLGLMAFFLVYTFVFNWGFDRLFGLPLSAMGARQPA